MSLQRLVIEGSLLSLNEVINTAKQHWSLYAKEKKQRTYSVGVLAMAAGLKPVKTPPLIRIWFFAKDKRIEKDNLLINTKYVLDGLVEGRVLEDDRWDQIGDLDFRFRIDRDRPRIEVEIIEEPV